MISHKDSNARNRRCTSARIAQTKQGPEVNITRALHAARRPLTRVARSAWTAAKARILGGRQKAVILNLGPAHVVLRGDVREKNCELIPGGLLERVDAGDGLAEYEGVDVVSSLVGVDALQIRHVPHR